MATGNHFTSSIWPQLYFELPVPSHVSEPTSISGGKTCCVIVGAAVTQKWLQTDETTVEIKNIPFLRGALVGKNGRHILTNLNANSAQRMHIVPRNKYHYKDIPLQPSLPLSVLHTTFPLLLTLIHTLHFNRTLYLSASPPSGPQQHDTVNYYAS